MTPEQIREGRRLIEAWRAAASEGLASAGCAYAKMEATWWLADNANALLDAAERTEAAERELAEAREGLQAGRDLMAVVHRDGGHYREQYGDRKASEDAITIVGALRVAYDDAMHKLAEAQADSERFEWWFSSDVDKWNFMSTYFQGIRERWPLSQWRAAIDAERGKR